MKRILIVIITVFLIFLSGCVKNEGKSVKTIIENNDDILVAINYPHFGYRKIDTKLDSYIKETYENFKNDFTNKYSYKNQAELNIDYTYKILNERYINVVIKTFINHSSLAHPINEIKTFNFDKQNNRNFYLDYIISNDELKKIVPLIKKELISKYKDCILMNELNSYINDDFSHYHNFSLSEDYLTLYFEPYLITAGYCNIISIDIPLDKIELKIPFERGVFKEKRNDKIIPNNHKTDPKKPAIALTFDDGPSKYTDNILDLLKENDAVGTFFILGNKVNSYHDTIKKMYKNGNEIGNHSYNHKWLTRITDDELVNQINQTQNIIKDVTGFTPKLFRPTYGSINKHLREKVNLDIVMWTVDTSDWKSSNSKRIAERTINKVKDGSIILMHDTHKQSYESLKIILSVLKEQGYQFVTVSELKEIAFFKQSTTTTR